MIQTDSATVIGLVISGGEGRRLGGEEKGLVPWCGRPMAAWVVAALEAVVPDVIINANRALDDYAALARTVVPDLPSHAGQGPLSGLLSGLIEARAQGYEAVLVSPCDTPQVSGPLFARVLTAAGPFPYRPTLVAIDGRPQPLHGLYPVELIDELEAWLDSGNRRVREFAESVAGGYVDCREFADQLRNCNSPADLLEGASSLTPPV